MTQMRNQVITFDLHSEGSTKDAESSKPLDNGRRSTDNRTMSAPQSRRSLNVIGNVIVCTETDESDTPGPRRTKPYSRGIINNGVEAEDHNAYRRQGNQWQMQTPEASCKR